MIGQKFIALHRCAVFEKAPGEFAAETRELQPVFGEPECRIFTIAILHARLSCMKSKPSVLADESGRLEKRSGLLGSIESARLSIIKRITN
jgi:hypothetical protein